MTHQPLGRFTTARRLLAGVLGISTVLGVGCNPPTPASQPSATPTATPGATPTTSQGQTSKGDFRSSPQPPRTQKGEADGGKGDTDGGKGAVLAPKDYSAEWLAHVAEKRRSDPEWMPLVYTDPRLPEELALANFSFRAFQILEDDRALIMFGGQVLLLDNGPGYMVDGREYKLKGLIKPAKRYQYVDVQGGIRTVQAVTYCGPAPDLPPVERTVVADAKPSGRSDSTAAAQPQAKKPAEEPLRKLTIDPIGGRVAHIATAKYALANIQREPGREAEWVTRGSLRKISKATEVELVSWERDYSKIRLDGKEWYIDSSWIPAESK